MMEMRKNSDTPLYIRVVLNFQCQFFKVRLLKCLPSLFMMTVKTGLDADHRPQGGIEYHLHFLCHEPKRCIQAEGFIACCMAALLA